MLPLLRAVIGLTALAILFQGITMGIYLSGRDSFLRMHEMGASLVAVLVLVMLVVSIIYKVRDHGERTPLTFSIVTFVLVAIEMMLGYTHNTSLHIPVALLLFGGMVRMTMWAGPEFRLRQAVAAASASASVSAEAEGVAE